MSRAKREQDVHLFLRSKLLCPWGRQAAGEGKVVYADASKFKTLCKDVRSFVSMGPGRVLVTLAPVDLTTHVAVERQAWAMFVDLFMASDVLAGTVMPRTDMTSMMDKARRDRFKRPMLGLDGRPLFTISMSPHYPSGHPRWAPHLLLSSTWAREVGSVQKSSPAVVATVRDKRTELVGELYDSDELVLPIAA